MPQKAITVPMERSISPSRITIVTPIAMMPVMETCLRIFRRFPAVIKFFAKME